MQDSPLWTYLQRVQKALKSGNADVQDIEICNLQEFLDAGCPDYFPSSVYPLVLRALRYYCTDVLARLALEANDRQYVQAVFAATIGRIEAQAQRAFEIERQMQRFMTGLKAAKFASAAEIVAALQRSAGEMLERRIDRDEYVAAQSPDSPPGRGRGWVPEAGDIPMSRTHPCPSQEGISDSRPGKHHKIPTPCPSQEGNSDSRELREVEHEYRRLCKTPFTARTVTPFLERLLKTAFLSESEAAQFAPLRSIFWDQAAEQVQMKTVLVNPLSQEARITRLDVATTLEPNGVDHLRFDNEVDERMFSSCWQAIEAARSFLEQRFPDLLERKGIHVVCRFPDPTVEYSDASVSALLGVKVVGDLLDLPVDPAAIISAEVDCSGKIRPVNNMVAKVIAAERHAGIHALYLPFESAPVRVERIALRRVSTFSEAVEQYYGAAYQQKQQQISRRKILKGAVGLAMAPLGFFAFKNIFSHPVSEQDIWLLEYAQDLYNKQSNYQKAQEILLTLLNKFKDINSSSETNQLKAQALTDLGIIYRQIYRHQECVAAFKKAFDYWKAVHNQEQQAEQFLHIGVAYLDTVTVGGMRQNSELALRYIHQAHDMLDPAMKGYASLQGRYCKWTGMAYYWLHDYELARKYTDACQEYFDESDPDYQISRQYAGMELSKLGDHDRAIEILESCLHHPVLQSSWNQARNLRSLSDVFFSLGEQQQAMFFARQAARVTEASNSPVLTILFQKFLLQHNLTFKVTI